MLYYYMIDINALYEKALHGDRRQEEEFFSILTVRLIIERFISIFILNSLRVTAIHGKVLEFLNNSNIHKRCPPEWIDKNDSYSVPN